MHFLTPVTLGASGSTRYISASRPSERSRRRLDLECATVAKGNSKEFCARTMKEFTTLQFRVTCPPANVGHLFGYQCIFLVISTVEWNVSGVYNLGNKNSVNATGSCDYKRQERKRLPLYKNGADSRSIPWKTNTIWLWRGHFCNRLFSNSIVELQWKCPITGQQTNVMFYFPRESLPFLSILFLFLYLFHLLSTEPNILS